LDLQAFIIGSDACACYSLPPEIAVFPTQGPFQPHQVCGVPPDNDPVLAWLCVLAIVNNAREKEERRRKRLTGQRRSCVLLWTRNLKVA